jgi:16S rRNA (cytidine1402-2'-O)-methyltransferase
MIIYEAPHHLKQTLKELESALGDRRITICRELTKKYEEAYQDTIRGMIEKYEKEEPRGEYVLVIQGKSFEEKSKEKMEDWKTLSVQEHMNYYLEQGVDKKEAMKKVAKDRGVSKRDIYKEYMLLVSQGE